MKSKVILLLGILNLYVNNCFSQCTTGTCGQTGVATLTRADGLGTPQIIECGAADFLICANTEYILTFALTHMNQRIVESTALSFSKFQKTLLGVPNNANIAQVDGVRFIINTVSPTYIGIRTGASEVCQFKFKASAIPDADITVGNVCAGQPFVFNGSCNGGTAAEQPCASTLMYEWSLGDASFNVTAGPTVASTNSTYTSVNNYPPGNYSGFLKLTNGSTDGLTVGCFDLDTTTMEVRDTPSIAGGAPVLKGGGTAAVCVNGTERKGIRVDPGGNTYTDYEWHFSSGPINFNASSGISTSGTADLDNISASTINAGSTPGSYNWGVKITDGNGCISRFEAGTPFFINDITAPSITATDNSGGAISGTICEGDTINLGAGACTTPSGGQDPCTTGNFTSYRWRAYGENASDSIYMYDSTGANGNVVASMLGKINPEDNEVEYILEVEGANGCSTSSTIKITTKIKPTLELWGDNTKQDTVTAPFNTCEGVAFNLWAECDLCPTGGLSPSNPYSWDSVGAPNVSVSSTRELDNPAAGTPQGTYDYTVTFQAANGCSVDSTITVGVLETPTPDIQVLDTTNVEGEYCSNDSIKIQAYPRGSTNPTTGLYTYTYYRKIGTEAEQRFNVNPSASSFIWTAFNETSDLTATVRYRVEVSAGSCVAEADTTIEVAQSPTLALSVARGYCTDSTSNTINLQPSVDGGSPFPNTSPNPYIYHWTIDGDTSVNGSFPVVYDWDQPTWQSGALPEQQDFAITLYVEDAAGCRSPVSEREFDVDYCGEIILVKTKNSNAVTAIDGRVCEGDTLNLEIQGQTDNEEYSYEWNGVADSISTYSIIVDENTPDTIFTRIIVSRYRTDTVRYVCGQVPITTPIISAPLDPYTPIRDPVLTDPTFNGGPQIQQLRTNVLNAPVTTINSQTDNRYTSGVHNATSSGNNVNSGVGANEGKRPNTSISTINSFSSQTQYFNSSYTNMGSINPATMNTAVNTGGFIYCNRVVSYLQILRDGVDTSIVSRPDPIFYPSADTSVCLNEVLQASVKCPDCEPLIDYRFGGLAAVSGVTDPDSIVLQDFTITGDRVIQLTVKDFYQCEDTLRRNITASPLPGLAAVGNGRYCPTSSTLIEANTSAIGNSTYEWSTTQTSRAISVNSTGRYYVTATLGLCSEVDSIDVAQYPVQNPFIMDKTGSRIISSTYYICGPAGDTIYLDTSSCYNCTVQWNTGETTEDLFVNTQGGYYINVIDSNGCNAITPPLMVVQSTTGYNATITASPAEICGGQSAVLEVPPCVNCQYDWFYKTSPTNYSRVDSIRTLTTGVVGEYYAVIHNNDDCSFETQPFDVINKSVGIPNIYGSSDSICNTESVDIWTDFDAAYTYQWFKDGVVISGEVDTMLTTSDTGAYYVEVTFPNGCVEPSSIWTIEKATFAPPISPLTGVICQGASIIVSTPLHPGWTYQWYRNGNRINGAIGSSYSATLPGEYYVNVTTDYLCEKRTSVIKLTSSSINQPVATTNTPNICFGDDFGQLSVSLCPGCSYQWYDNATGLPVLDSIRPQYYRVDTVDATSSGVKQYYAEVHRDGCFETSNLVTINFNAVVKPAIFSPSGTPSVCNGRSATLATNGCVGCDYNWFKNGIPVIGGPNDTIITINSTNDTGVYSVEVTYASLCVDTSADLTITNGGFPATITSSANNICNGASVTLSATPVNSQNVYTLFRGPTAVTGNIRQSSPDFITNVPGVYRIEVENANGCRQLTPPFDLRGININPILTSRATSNPNSIDSVSAICGPNGRVFFEATNCAGCDFQFEKIGTPTNTIVQSLSSDKDVLSDAGPAGAGNYLVSGELQGCQANSNLVQINYLPRLDVTTTFTDTSICDGSSIILSYDSTALSNCTNCGYRWLRDPINTIGAPINGATNPNLTTTTAGNYALQITDLDNGCVDTSLSIRVIEVYPPVGFGLQLDSLGSVSLNPATPLASTGNAINLNEWIVPAYAQSSAIDTNTTSVWFTSAPYSGNLSPNAGIENDSIFNPDDSLSGFHLITYHFDTSGCEFVTNDVLEVLPPPGVDVVNLNGQSVPYEACVSDTLIISTSNLNYPVDSVYVYDQQGLYTAVAIDSVTVDTNVFGGFTVYNTTLIIRVPPEAKESSFKLVNSTGAPGDTLLTAFVLIHNQDLQITGLPNMLCSNGTPIVLTGTPSGGTFFVEDSSGNILPTVMMGDTLDPTMLAASYYVDGSQDVDVIYSFTESYTNGNLCPQLDTTKIDIEAREVFLNQVIYNQIAVSQDKELLTNLVSRVFPQRAKAIRPSFDISFSGSFTNPAGNPTHFLPNNAGVGRHALTYIIQNGDCINSVEDSITVIPAPIALALPDTICSNHAPFTIERDPNYTFQVVGPYFVDAGITSYTDTRNIMSIRSVLNNQAIDTVTNATNLEEYIYDVSQYADSVTHDTLIIEYRFLRSTDSLGVVDSMDYVIGKIYKPIFIEAQNDTVRINTNVVDSIYCESNTLRLLGGIPSTNSYGIGGYFTLEGGTGDYVTEDTLDNNVINPYLVHNIDSTMDVNYRMIYYLDGIVCRNSDTMNILIPERVNTDFFTATGTDEFCDSDPAVLITSNVTAPDTAIWKVGGVPQSTYEFRPQPLSPGIHVVELEAIDIYGCRYSTKDTFTVHGLPDITFTPAIAGQYCTNDAAVPFVIDPSPYCPDFDSTLSQFIIDESFDGGIPATWTVINEEPNAEAWQPDNTDPFLGSGAIRVDTTHDEKTDTYLVTDTLQFIAGHQYKITFSAKVDERDPVCNTGHCNARMRVVLGRQNVLPGLSLQVPAYYDSVYNDAGYVPYSADFTPANSGAWFLGLHIFTDKHGRGIRVDELKVRDITASACNDRGIGYMNGPGATNIQDSAYVFNPATVDAGNHDVTYIYTNTEGCTDSVVQNITINAYPIVTMTDLDSFYCDNNPAQTIVGSPAGGQFSNQINGNLFDTLSPQFTPATYRPYVGGADIVRYDYTDPATLCSSFVEDYVFVQQIVDTATFDIDATGRGFCEDENGVVLTVTSTGVAGTGDFYGFGVRQAAPGSGNSTFYPDSAIIDAGRVGDMELTYIFPTGSGCVDTTQRTVRIHANPDLAFMNLPDSICLNGDTITIRVINRVIGGSLGNMVTYDTIPVGNGAYTTSPTNFVGLFDLLAPNLGVNHPDPHAQVRYEYTIPSQGTSGCSATIEDSVRLDSVPIIRYQGLDPYYCENQDSSLVMLSPTYKAGSGYLQLSEGGDTTIFNQSFYWVDPPALVDPNLTTNQYNFYYEYEDTRGCVGSGTDSFEIRAFPRITFAANAQDSFCRTDSLYNLMDRVPDSISYGFFTDNLALTTIMNDSLLNLAALPGPRLVTYNFTDSSTLCSNEDSFRVYVFNTPDLTFQTFGGCVGSDVIFDGQMLNANPSIDSVTNIAWDFGDGTTIGNAPLDTTRTGIPTIMHQYGISNVYNAILSVENQGLCVSSDTQKVIISPSVDLANGDYTEDFQGANGGWQDDQPINTANSNQVWQYVSSLEGDIIKDSLNGAWVTTGNQPYGQGMKGWLYTPCFDFTQSERPMIKMDMWRSMLNNVDGLVLEYYDNDSTEWYVVGDNTEGVNWYKNSFVLARPGQGSNVTYAWSGESPMRSNNKAWEDPRFRLDQFIGQDNIRFRLNFATAPQSIQGLNLEGVAVDNIFVGERSRNVLVEHFSNEQHKDAVHSNMHYTDLSVYDKVFSRTNGLDVVLIQYASGNAGYDVNYNVNTADADARVLTYGLSSENRFLLNGMRVTSSNLSTDMKQEDLDYAMLQFPKFDINIGTIVSNGANQISVNADVTRLEYLADDSIDVHVVIIQDSLAMDSNGQLKRNVMRKMLPDNGGTEFSTTSFPIGVPRVVTQSWNYADMKDDLETAYQSVDPNVVINNHIPARLEAVVFVQNRRTKEVYQAASTQDINTFINVDNIADAVGQEIMDLKLFPNPAYDFFNISFSQPLEGEYDWKLIDVMGRVLRTGTAAQGIETFQVQANELSAGTYFFTMQDDEVYIQRKVVIVR